MALSGKASTNDRLRAEAAARGVAPSRLVFAPFAPREVHRGRLALLDLMLDTRGCNGSTTVADVLAVGAPALTVAGGAWARRGDGYYARMGASVLGAVMGGLAARLVTRGLREYATGGAGARRSISNAHAYRPGELAALKAMEYRVAMYMLKHLKYFNTRPSRRRVRAWRLRSATMVTTTCLRLRSKLKIVFIVRQNPCVHAYQGSKHTQTTSHQPPPEGPTMRNQ